MLSPCDLEFNRCYNIEKNELQMLVKCPKINIHLTPVSLKLVLDVMEIMKTTSVKVGSFEPRHEIFQQCGMWDQQSLRSA